MIQNRWLLILEDQPAPDAPGQRYRLWLVELDEDQPSAPLQCRSLDELYQALFDRQRRLPNPPAPGE